MTFNETVCIVREGQKGKPFLQLKNLHQLVLGTVFVKTMAYKVDLPLSPFSSCL